MLNWRINENEYEGQVASSEDRFPHRSAQGYTTLNHSSHFPCWKQAPPTPSCTGAVSWLCHNLFWGSRPFSPNASTIPSGKTARRSGRGWLSSKMSACCVQKGMRRVRPGDRTEGTHEAHGLDPTAAEPRGRKGTPRINGAVVGLQCPLGQKGGAEWCGVLGSVGGGDAAPNEFRTQHKLLRGALADWVPKGTPDTPVLRRAGMEGSVDGTAEGEFQGAGSTANGHQPRLAYLLVFPLCCMCILFL